MCCKSWLLLWFHSLTGELSRNWREADAAAELVTVTVMKNPTFGFHIMGGIDAGGNPYRPDDDGVFITYVAPGGAADGQVEPGDKILMVRELFVPDLLVFLFISLSKILTSQQCDCRYVNLRWRQRTKLVFWNNARPWLRKPNVIRMKSMVFWFSIPTLALSSIKRRIYFAFIAGWFPSMRIAQVFAIQAGGAISRMMGHIKCYPKSTPSCKKGHRRCRRIK